MTDLAKKTLPTDFPLLAIKSKQKKHEVEKLVSGFILSPEMQDKFVNGFEKQMEEGLTETPSKDCTLLMENTFVRKLTDGTEHGVFMALDLGGTNFRVILIHVDNGKVDKELVDYYEVPERTRLGPGLKLFDFLAECIADFMKKNTTNGHIYKLGFTFSFPMHTQGLRVGILKSWTKSFRCSGVEGQDVVNMLEEAMHVRRSDLKNVVVSCILNDTTGTLVQGSFIDQRCALGMILGTGSNASYIEKTSKVPKWKGQPQGEEMVIDIEWGAYGDSGAIDFLRTPWDDRVDEMSLMRGSFTFEKYFAGKYLGDLCREVLLTLAKEGLVFHGETGQLYRQGCVHASDVTLVELDTFSNKISETQKVLEGLGFESPSWEDCMITQYVWGLISYRGIQLVSLLTGLLLNRMQRPHCTIAIDGSLFRLHPRYEPLMKLLIAKCAPKMPFSLLLTQDGSGKGAAMLAAIEHNLASKKPEENCNAR